MAGQEKWYFTREQLLNSPSRKCGLDADKELAYRQQAANLIQDMGQRLQVSQLCINTAIVYMHRFYAFHSFTQFHRNSMAAAALFLAAKVEEQPRKLEHVIKVAHMCLHRNDSQPALDTRSDHYQDQAQDLVFNENVLLQTLGFDVAIDHPHTHVVRTCNLVRASKDLAQTSYFMASNSLHLTTMCLQYRPTVVACFCIHLASKWSNWAIPQSNEGKHWFYYVDRSVSSELLERLTSEFLHIFDRCPSRLKKKIMSISNNQGTGSPQGPAHGSTTSVSPFDKEPRKIPQEELDKGELNKIQQALFAPSTSAPNPPGKMDYREYQERQQQQQQQRDRTQDRPPTQQRRPLPTRPPPRPWPAPVKPSRPSLPVQRPSRPVTLVPPPPAPRPSRPPTLPAPAAPSVHRPPSLFSPERRPPPFPKRPTAQPPHQPSLPMLSHREVLPAPLSPFSSPPAAVMPLVHKIPLEALKKEEPLLIPVLETVHTAPPVGVASGVPLPPTEIAMETDPVLVSSLLKEALPHRADKKKKKEKHKHKDRDKREERKKHKKDKDKRREAEAAGTAPRPSSPQHLKITINRDIISGTVAPPGPPAAPGLKIKIPKERLRTEPPQALKIKISKEVMEGRKRPPPPLDAPPPKAPKTSSGLVTGNGQTSYSK